MSNPSQAEAQEAHFIKRARQRFGLRISPERYRFLILKVKENYPGTKFVGHQPPHRTVWRIRAGGYVMRVVYDHRTDRLVTCLPVAYQPPKKGKSSWKSS